MNIDAYQQEFAEVVSEAVNKILTDPLAQKRDYLPTAIMRAWEERHPDQRALSVGAESAGSTVTVTMRVEPGDILLVAEYDMAPR